MTGRYRMPEAMRPLAGMELRGIRTKAEAESTARRLLRKLRGQGLSSCVTFDAEPRQLHEHAVVPRTVINPDPLLSELGQEYRAMRDAEDRELRMVMTQGYRPPVEPSHFMDRGDA